MKSRQAQASLHESLHVLHFICHMCLCVIFAWMTVVKSEVIATEEENSRLEQERERVVAAMAAKQELKERQEAQDQQDALTPEHHQEQHQELALAQQLSVQEHELAKLPQHGGVDTGPDVYKEPVEEGEPDLLAHPKKIGLLCIFHVCIALSSPFALICDCVRLYWQIFLNDSDSRVQPRDLMV